MLMIIAVDKSKIKTGIKNVDVNKDFEKNVANVDI